jgi:hypothetical protein
LVRQSETIVFLKFGRHGLSLAAADVSAIGLQVTSVEGTPSSTGSISRLPRFKIMTDIIVHFVLAGIPAPGIARIDCDVGERSEIDALGAFVP